MKRIFITLLLLLASNQAQANVCHMFASFVEPYYYDIDGPVNCTAAAIPYNIREQFCNTNMLTWGNNNYVSGVPYNATDSSCLMDFEDGTTPSRRSYSVFTITQAECNPGETLNTSTGVCEPEIDEDCSDKEGVEVQFRFIGIETPELNCGIDGCTYDIGTCITLHLMDGAPSFCTGVGTGEACTGPVGEGGDDYTPPLTADDSPIEVDTTTDPPTVDNTDTPGPEPQPDDDECILGADGNIYCNNVSPVSDSDPDVSISNNDTTITIHEGSGDLPPGTAVTDSSDGSNEVVGEDGYLYPDDNNDGVPDDVDRTNGDPDGGNGGTDVDGDNQDGNGDCDDTVDDCGDGREASYGLCGDGAPPVCEGDAIDCQVLRAQYETLCVFQVEDGQQFDLGGDTQFDDGAQATSEEDIDSFVGDDSGFGAPEACFNDMSFSAMGTTYTIPFSLACPLFEAGSVLIMILASMVSLRIVMSSFN